MRADGVRTVVWVTPWVNLDSRDGQIPPAARVRAPAPRAGAELRAGRRRRALRPRARDGEPYVGQWWMGTGSPVDFTARRPSEWWREQAKRVLELGRRGDQGRRRRGLLHPRRRAARRRAHAARRPRGRSAACTAARLQRALDEVHPGTGVLFGRSGWIGQHATGLTWGGDQASDFWSLRVLVVATLAAAAQRLLELVARRRRLPRPPAGRALPARAARPLAAVRLLHAADAGARAHAAGAVELRRAGGRPLPRLRAAARAARPLRARGGRHRGAAPGCRSSGRCA